MKLTVYIIPESGKNHLVSKSVPLRNDSAKVKDICALLTHMVGVSNPSDYGLYSIIDGEGKSCSRAFGLGHIFFRNRLFFRVMKIPYVFFRIPFK